MDVRRDKENGLGAVNTLIANVFHRSAAVGARGVVLLRRNKSARLKAVAAATAKEILRMEARIIQELMAAALRGAAQLLRRQNWLLLGRNPAADCKKEADHRPAAGSVKRDLWLQDCVWLVILRKNPFLSEHSSTPTWIYVVSCRESQSDSRYRE